MHEEPVEILVRMAESGEIDPWNIDIVDVTDRFFSELERLKELDLRISGRTLFYSATLLRMKSDYLEESEWDEESEDDFSDDDPDLCDDEFSFDAEDLSEPIERLEREIQRRIGRKRQRKTPLTLYELIKELKTAEKEDRRGHRRRRMEVPVFIEAEDVVSVAHDEDYHEVSGRIYSVFREASARNEDSTVALGSLCDDLGCGVRDVYLPLLFLMIEGKVILRQEDFFGEIYVSPWRADAFDDDSEM